jgi:GNAT superfamily N-acetyltransferase
MAAIERLGPEDAVAGVVLSDEVGWNQTLEDWQDFLAAGLVFGVRDGGRVVATAALLPMPPLTWVSLVIVTGDRRRQGLAQALMLHCLAEAAARGLQPYLDATPAGATVYGPMGFVGTGLALRRLRRPGAPQSLDAPSKAMTPSDIERLLAADTKALGTGRRSIIERFAARPGSRILSNAGAVVLVRDGRRARHVGPLIADDETAAITLLDEVIRTETAPLLVDLSDAHPTVADALLKAGFIVERPFTRMCLGPAQTEGSAQIVASAGPEFG